MPRFPTKNPYKCKGFFLNTLYLKKEFLFLQFVRLKLDQAQLKESANCSFEVSPHHTEPRFGITFSIAEILETRRQARKRYKKNFLSESQTEPRIAGLGEVELKFFLIVSRGACGSLVKIDA